ncbi:MAG: cbb3-type cytochrome c oxidase subunit 3 [Gammaproteobacteria bacterium]|nr:cbb3-type cytochrome c oxidase subunit 3 [Gammaproteobacteria bacterium]
MDIHTLQGIVTALMMVTFLGIVWWAYSKKTQKRFNEAANLPFADEAVEQQSMDKEANNE